MSNFNEFIFRHYKSFILLLYGVNLLDLLITIIGVKKLGIGVEGNRLMQEAYLLGGIVLIALIKIFFVGFICLLMYYLYESGKQYKYQNKYFHLPNMVLIFCILIYFLGVISWIPALIGN